MQKFKNDFKDLTVITWPTSQKELLKDPVIQIRISKKINIQVGDFIEVSSKNGLVLNFYKIEEILETKASSAFPKMSIYKCRFSKHQQPTT